MKNKIILVLCLLLVSCTSIDKSQAEAIGVSFVKQNVKFYSKEEVRIDLPSFEISALNSYKEGSLWVINMHVESKLLNETKKNDLFIKINSKGQVVDFNGQKVLK
jgi:hypothetical protein